MTPRERVLCALENKPVDRVPFSFWFHFQKNEDTIDALADPAILTRSYEGHKRYMEALQPDFVKIMSDGLFLYPCEALKKLETVEDLEGVRAIGKDDPWIQTQVGHVRRVVDIDPDTCYFYNVFSPSSLFRILVGEEKYLRLFRQDPLKVSQALGRMGEGLAVLTEAIVQEGGADGLFLCVQNPNLGVVSDEEYAQYIAATDKQVLNAANAAGGKNILHICGYEGRRNHLDQWASYEAKALNWATFVEEVSLSEGKALFGNRCVVGGFDNTANGVLNKGSRQEVEAFVEELLAKAGKTGIMVAADCSLPFGIAVERLAWVRDKLKALG